MSKNRLLYGFGGCGNFGDDYMLDRWISFYEENRPDLKVIAVRPDTWLAEFYSKNSKFCLEKNLYGLFRSAIKSLSGITEDHIEHNIIAGKKAAFDALTSAEFSNLFSNLEAMQMFGGGYLNRRYAEPWGIASMLSEISMVKGIPLIATGVGLTPALTKERRSVDEIISRFSLIEVRDEESYSFFSNKYPKNKILLGQDDPFISNVKVMKSNSERQPRINVCVQSNLSGDESHPLILSRLMDFIEGSENIFELSYLRFHDGPDQVFLDKLEEKLGRKIKSFSKNDMLKEGLPITPSDICVSTRFHLHLLAARIGAKGTYIVTGDDYYATKHRSVCALGSGWIDFLKTTEKAMDLVDSNCNTMNDYSGIITKNARLRPYM